MRLEDTIKQMLTEVFQIETPAVVFPLRNGLISITVKKVTHKCGHATNLVAVVPCQDSLRAFDKQARKHIERPCRKCVVYLAKEAADKDPSLIITALDVPLGRRVLHKDRHIVKMLSDHFTQDRLLSLLERSLYLHPEEAVRYITYTSGMHHNNYQNAIRQAAVKTLKKPKEVPTLKMPEKIL
jgi:hypothetical protein